MFSGTTQLGLKLIFILFLFSFFCFLLLPLFLDHVLLLLEQGRGELCILTLDELYTGLGEVGPELGDRDALVYRVRRLMKTSDRQVRDAIAELPVVWDDGYFIPTSYNEASGYIASMRSRQAAIGQRLRVLDDYLRTQCEPVKVEQMSWVEG